MAIPAFGVSQRFELSLDYLRSNEALSSSDNLLFDRIRPSENVAEEGQVVLLSNHNPDAETRIVPDAAGYRLQFNPKSLSAGELESCLVNEISKYRVGVNQVQKGVSVPNRSTGYGWDISCIPKQPAKILHTGSEPISRFDCVGVQFPTEADVKAQQDANSNNFYKFATYPVRENYEAMRYSRFHYDLDAFRCSTDIGNAATNAAVQYAQFPALCKLIGSVMNTTEVEDFDVREEIERCRTNPQAIDPLDTPLISKEAGCLASLKVAKAAIDFVATLRPPMIIAQVIDFYGPQPHRKNRAECGDEMKCILLPY